ncbi:hypothetical protein [Actinobacillus equuli]|nr:hypothetical protein [Actinobacillus equuli]WGE53806.1 hypothetical protein NYR69_04405 [Actinobacillus equuli subsp. haemolyticus]
MEVKDAHGNTIIFKENLKGESNIEIIQKNKQGEDRLLLKLPYLAEHPKISSFFITKIKDRGDYLIVSTKIQPSFNATGVPYVDDYFIYYLFRLNDKTYEFDKKLSDYFGQGGDIYDLNDINDENTLYPKIIYSYPFKTKLDIDNEINSSLFKKWNKRQIKNGVVVKKTLLQDVPNYVQNEKRYLIKGDGFQIKSISAKWLEIIYKNSKGNEYIGWILCKDTSVCE